MDCARDAMMHAKAEALSGGPIPPPSGRSLVEQLVEDVADGLRVLRTRDGVWISEDQILDRARNIVQGLVYNYSVEPWPEGRS